MAILPVECKYVTDDCIREWKSGGSGSSVKLPVVVPPERFIYELCWTIVRGELPLSKCKIAIDSVEFSERQIKEETASILADTIAHMAKNFCCLMNSGFDLWNCQNGLWNLTWFL